MPSFVAIDVETANPDLASICQVGVARFEQGMLVDTWSTLIDPGDYFCPTCIYVHGIEEEDVEGQPTIADVHAEILNRVEGLVVVSHTSFDRTAIARAFAKAELEVPSWVWLDSSRVARRIWPEVARRGYGLANLAERLGIKFQHHNALEDALTAGQVLIHAIKDSDQDLDWWMRRVRQPIEIKDRTTLGVEINPEGVLYGETVVFTGTLSVPRSSASVSALEAGCAVSNTVNKRVTLLVVGDQDVTKLAGHSKSSKHRRAEQLISEGQEIRILKESDFFSMIVDQS